MVLEEMEKKWKESRGIRGFVNLLDVGGEERSQHDDSQVGGLCKRQRRCRSHCKGNGEKRRFGLGGWGPELHVVVWKLRCLWDNKMEGEKNTFEYSQWVEHAECFLRIGCTNLSKMPSEVSVNQDGLGFLVATNIPKISVA